MADYLRELEPITKVKFEEYNNNYFTRHTAERLIELIVEEAVDINGLIIIGKGNSPPKDYFSSFINMAKIGILDMNFAKKTAGTTGLRNRLAHEYEDVDIRIVWNSLKRFTIIYKKYLELVYKYIEKQ